MLSKLKGYVSNTASSNKEGSTPAAHPNGFTTATIDRLFPATEAAADGEECLHDCQDCPLAYPAKFSIDEEERLYGLVKAWAHHLLVATGRDDWRKHPEKEDGSLLEAIGSAGERSAERSAEQRLMLSACNMPLPTEGAASALPASEAPTTALLLPAFTYIDNVTRSRVPELMTRYVDVSAATTSSFAAVPPAPPTQTPAVAAAAGLSVRPCLHAAVVLLCSHRTRDARCGQSAPLLRRELERHLRPLGLQRDLDDSRPGGVGIYFVSHVGGHKFSANVIVYRRTIDTVNDTTVESPAALSSSSGTPESADRGAAQCIWLARVRPEDCENIVRYTILQGKVVKPQWQLKGGFDRQKKLVSW